MFPLRALSEDAYAGDTSSIEPQTSSAVSEDSAEKSARYLKKVEIHGTNVVSPELILE